MTTFAVVGAGWRAGFFWRAAAGLDGLDCVGAVVRTPRELPVPTFGTLQECLSAARPDFVVTSTPWPVTPEVIREAVGHGLPVLAETPPAPDLEGLRALWSDVGESGLVQVAEQYLLMPSHAARLALVRSGAIGTPGQVQVSSTHQYHAVSMMRGFLGVGRGPVTVRATRTTAPLVDPLVRDAWSGDDTAHDAGTVLATVDFGDGRSGLYDFTDNQWHNQLRFRRLLVRGSHGELMDDEVVRLAAPETILRSRITRYTSGRDLDLDGFDTEHLSWEGQVLYRNPYRGRRWMDEEIAIATLLEQTAAWVRGEGEPPYPLADGIFDHRVALAVEEALATDRTVRTGAEPWDG
ncbi:gfo/Idh/MocA family oxidoreductase [Auraticoccus sp. F435]|uniref:Gfo/Idh/MocA family oxidoreductase n=1 Tax=Auraticoccus cholistanensis TaxID=2656650 RepID=A0A6A9USH0_9ACTN|nr:gfo/Idh/MocA family oxidoreductase [Auraticoccus cholistanensis]MVA74632.1 gfo/Idh/MocA family oxidoreductase [Auraticoccus cholistanensis]